MAKNALMRKMTSTYQKQQQKQKQQSLSLKKEREEKEKQEQSLLLKQELEEQSTITIMDQRFSSQQTNKKEKTQRKTLMQLHPCTQPTHIPNSPYLQHTTIHHQYTCHTHTHST